MLHDQERTERELRLKAATEAEGNATRELGPYPEDPVHYALKPTLGGLLLAIVTSAVLDVEPGGLQSLVLLGILGGLYWALHTTQSNRRRQWDRVRQRHYDSALRRQKLDLGVNRD